MNAIQIPRPTRSAIIEAQQAFFGKGSNKLIGEERVATSLLVDQARQRAGEVRLAVK